MSRIVCWDNGLGMSSVVAASVSVMLGLHYDLNVLLVNESKYGEGVEGGFPVDGAVRCDGALPSEQGMDALMRMAVSGRLSSGNFTDYTRPILQRKLDLVSGSVTTPKRLTDTMFQVKSEVLNVAEVSYDLVISQASWNGYMNQHTKHNNNLPYQEIIVVVLDQQRQRLDDFFGNAEYDSMLSERCWVCVLANYDERSRWSIQNIKRRYQCGVPVFGIPYLTEHHDAWNNRELLRFFGRYRMLPRKGGKREMLIESYRHLTQGLLELTGRHSAGKQSMRGA